MLIQLPVETWIEILDWLRRHDLIKKLDTLWDRQFTPIMQDWLHKYTKNVKIGKLLAADDGLYNGQWQKVSSAEMELPKNVTNFERITIRYFDASVLALLRQMRPLFHKICLMIRDGYEDESFTKTQTALHALMPMINIGSVESIIMDLKWLHFFSINYQPSVLMNVSLLEIREFFKLDAKSELHLINWLFTPRQDGHPRTLLLSHCEDPDGFCEKIRERFLDLARKLASPFFIRMRNNLPNQPMVTENARTGEQLIVNDVFSSGSGLISNFPLIVDQGWLAKKKGELRKWHVLDQQQAIWLYRLELGPLDPIGDDPQQPPTGSSSEATNNPQEKPGNSKVRNLEEEDEEPGKKRARLT